MNKIYARIEAGKNGKQEIVLSGKEGKKKGATRVKGNVFSSVKPMLDEVPKIWEELTEREAETIRYAEKIGRKYDLKITSPEVGVFRVKFPKEMGIGSVRMNSKELAKYLKIREFLFLKAMADEKGYTLKEDLDGNRYVVFEKGEDGKEKAVMSLRPAAVEEALQELGRTDAAAEERKKAGIE